MGIFAYVTIGATLIAGMFGSNADVAASLIATVQNDDSVELGLSELSPNGEAGGYAMPASGCGVVHDGKPEHDCQNLTLSCPSGWTIKTYSTPGTYSYKLPDTAFNVRVWGAGGGGGPPPEGSPVRSGTASAFQNVVANGGRGGSGNWNSRAPGGTAVNGDQNANGQAGSRAASRQGTGGRGGNGARGGAGGIGATIPNIMAANGAWPGGGGGGSYSGGPGGGGGGWAVKAYPFGSFTPGAPVTVRVGQGGPATGNGRGGRSGRGANGAVAICVKDAPPEPTPTTVNLRVRNITTNTPPGSWSPNDITIASGDQIALAWSSNGTACNAPVASRNKGFDPAGNPGNPTPGVDNSIIEPASGSFRYVINCVGPGGPKQDRIKVTVLPSPPTVSLEVKNITTGDPNWTTGIVKILTGEHVGLRWNASSNATRCVSGGFGFRGKSQFGAVHNQGGDVTEPTSGNEKTYSYRCENSGGWSPWAQVTVETLSNEVGITTDKTIVNTGDPVNISWDTRNNPADSCTLSGPGLNLDPVSTDPDDRTGSRSVTINGQSTYTLSCESGGTDSVTIYIVGTIGET